MQRLFDQPPEGAPTAGAERAMMTDLSEQLAGPDGPAAAAALLARLDRVAEELTIEMTNGTAPDRFQSLTVLKDAVMHARSVLVAVAKTPAG